MEGLKHSQKTCENLGWLPSHVFEGTGLRTAKL